MQVFDWDKLRPKVNGKQRTRDAIIRHAFNQWVEGHSCYDDDSQIETADRFFLFRAAWIICEGFIENE